MLEYVLATAGLLIVVATLYGVISATRKYAVRTDNLVSSDYP